MNDSPPAALLHLRDQGPRQGHRRGQVDLQHGVPVGVGDGVDRLRPVGPGIVHQNVHPPHLLQGGTAQSLDIIAAGHVGHDRAALAAGAVENVFQRRLQLVLVSAADDDVRARLGQGPGHRLAKPLAAARDQGHPARQVEQVVCHHDAPIVVNSHWSYASALPESENGPSFLLAPSDGEKWVAGLVRGGCNAIHFVAESFSLTRRVGDPMHWLRSYQ